MKTLSFRLLSFFLILPLAGCTNIAEDVADHFAARSLQGKHDLILFEGDLAAFRSCLKQSDGAACPDPTAQSLRSNTEPARAELSTAGEKSVDALPDGHPARMAHEVLHHPLIKQSVDLHNHLRGHGSGSLHSDESGDCSKIHLPISTEKAADLHDQILRTTAAGGWEALHHHTRKVLAASDPADPDHQQKKVDAHKVKFLEKYVSAFFGNGHILNVRLDVTQAEAESYIARELGEHASTACVIYNDQTSVAGPETTALGNLDEVESDIARLHMRVARPVFSFRNRPAPAQAAIQDCARLASSIYDTVHRIAREGEPHRAVKIAQPGFISRDSGYAAQIPSIAVDIDPIAQHKHAVALEMKPATPTGKFDYTEVGSDLARVILEAVFDSHEELPATSHSTAGAHRLLPEISTSMSTHLDAMNRVNDTAQITSGVMLDRVIRGIGPLSLNNDALEDLIVTLVTTSVRKAAEKATWCWYACNLEDDVMNLYKDARQDVYDERMKLERDLEQHAADAAKRVCLALHMNK